MTSAKLFRNGQSQAVRLPREFALPGREVFVRRVGNAVLLVPTEDPWAGFEAALDQFSDDFMSERAQPAADMRETF
ncbi:MAG: type II toxin-antitoxin system VapB family antitoxin [Pseudomonadota bacterium]|nr:type II toxin-antitoxin system VapB family antitoxin [Pseudomonadota bacterium]